MKNFLMVLLLTAFTLPAFAAISIVTGRGRDSGYCNGNQSSSCVRMIEDRAKREGERDAEWRCRSNGGQGRGYTTNCNTSCIPGYIQPRDPNTYVQCSATCSMQCEVK